ncbi:MAG: hypothetical protein RXR20_00875 [Paraburkholderia sp.]|jgi:hypothetical protein|uniref:hypothetical protein n=1 Tax=Burkholderiaceae TaxID=119060 RepID=UPI0010FA4DDE|nr:hypothetical protein [Burkholderia sp. 4M9327F10]
MHEHVDPNVRHLEELVRGALEQSGIATLSEDDSALFLGLLTVNAVTRLLSIRGRDWTCGFIETLKANVLDEKRDAKAGATD